MKPKLFIVHKFNNVNDLHSPETQTAAGEPKFTLAIIAVKYKMAAYE